MNFNSTNQLIDHCISHLTSRFNPQNERCYRLGMQTGLAKLYPYVEIKKCPSTWAPAKLPFYWTKSFLAQVNVSFGKLTDELGKHQFKDITKDNLKNLIIIHEEMKIERDEAMRSYKGLTGKIIQFASALFNGIINLSYSKCVSSGFLIQTKLHSFENQLVNFFINDATPNQEQLRDELKKLISKDINYVNFFAHIPQDETSLSYIKAIGHCNPKILKNNILIGPSGDTEQIELAQYLAKMENHAKREQDAINADLFFAMSNRVGPASPSEWRFENIDDSVKPLVSDTVTDFFKKNLNQQNNITGLFATPGMTVEEINWILNNMVAPVPQFYSDYNKKPDFYSLREFAINLNHSLYSQGLTETHSIVFNEYQEFFTCSEDASDDWKRKFLSIKRPTVNLLPAFGMCFTFSAEPEWNRQFREKLIALFDVNPSKKVFFDYESLHPLIHSSIKAEIRDELIILLSKQKNPEELFSFIDSLSMLAEKGMGTEDGMQDELLDLFHVLKEFPSPSRRCLASYETYSCPERVIKKGTTLEKIRDRLQEIDKILKQVKPFEQTEKTDRRDNKPTRLTPDAQFKYDEIATLLQNAENLQELNSIWRKWIRKNHPDKVKEQIQKEASRPGHVEDVKKNQGRENLAHEVFTAVIDVYKDSLSHLSRGLV